VERYSPQSRTLRSLRRTFEFFYGASQANTNPLDAILDDSARSNDTILYAPMGNCIERSSRERGRQVLILVAKLPTVCERCRKLIAHFTGFIQSIDYTHFRTLTWESASEVAKRHSPCEKLHENRKLRFFPFTFHLSIFALATTSQCSSPVRFRRTPSQ